MRINTIASDIKTKSLKAELDKRLSSFGFEEGALLIHVPQVPLDVLEPEIARKRGYFSYPPQGLLYLSATFRLLGIETRIIDLSFAVLSEAQTETPNLQAAWRTALDDALAVFQNPFICVSYMFDSTYPEFKEVCEYIKIRKPESCIAVGGVGATADPQKLLTERTADLVFSHEGERSLESLYGYLRESTAELPFNLSFLDSQGSVLQTPVLAGGEVDLDIRGEFSKIPMTAYHQVGSLSNFSRMEGVDVPFAVVLSRRGCRAHCSFCGVRNFNGKAVRVREIDGVIGEMEHLHDNFGIRHFDWLDDDLLYDRDAALKMFDEIASRLPDITWQANNGLIASAITPEIMQAMENSGCMGFKVGLESGNASVLRSVHKPTNLAKFHSFAKLADEYPKMFVAVNFILGFPGEEFGQQLDSFKTAVAAKLDWNNFYVYQHIKNTELYLAYGGLGDDFVVTEHGKDAQGPNINPVRAGAFKNYQVTQGLLSGFDIVRLESSVVPSRDQLKEIWFTFNYVANFIRMPALFTESEIRLKNSIRWMEVLSGAYPDDPAMTCVTYFLQRRLAACPPSKLDTIKQSALKKFKNSEYWQFRDRQFGFSALLDGVIPELDPKFGQILNPV